MTGGQLVRMAAAAVAAIIFVLAGNDMRDIESVSGNSVAEAFYNAMGLFSYGMAALAVALAAPAGANALLASRGTPANVATPEAKGGPADVTVASPE